MTLFGLMSRCKIILPAAPECRYTRARATSMLHLRQSASLYTRRQGHVICLRIICLIVPARLQTKLQAVVGADGPEAPATQCDCKAIQAIQVEAGYFTACQVLLHQTVCLFPLPCTFESYNISASLQRLIRGEGCAKVRNTCEQVTRRLRGKAASETAYLW